MHIVRHLILRLFITAICLLPVFQAAVFAQGVCPNQIIVPSSTSVIPLYWQGDSIGGTWTSYAALLIPIRLPHCPRVFYMQFDTGSPYSILYTDMVQAIQLKYPRAFPKNIANGKIKDFRCIAGHTPITATEMVVASFDTASIDWNHTTQPQIIGTFGTDLIDNKIIVFDYPQRSLILSDTLNAALANDVSFTNCIYSNHSILLPAIIKGKATHIFFDTGASMFSLVTDKETCQSLTMADNIATGYSVPSWDKEMTAFTFMSTDSVEMDGLRLPLHAVTYMEGAQQSQIDRMRAMGIGGLMGNILFIDRRLILDLKQHRFGIIQ